MASPDKTTPVQALARTITADDLWHNEAVMALNAELGLTMDRLLRLAHALAAASPAAPIDMVLHCPKCGKQHIDGPDNRKSRWQIGDRALTPHGVGTIARISSGTGFSEAYFADLVLPPGHHAVNVRDLKWPNEPHRSHLCHGCGTIWRPADVPTNGVEAVKTKGKADSPVAASPAAPVQAIKALREIEERTRPNGDMADAAVNALAIAALSPPTQPVQAAPVQQAYAHLIDELADTAIANATQAGKDKP